MISNNVASPAFRAQQTQQKVAFKGNNDFNPGKATASMFIPGSGQLGKEEYGKAALHLGLFAVTAAGSALLGKSLYTALKAGSEVAHPVLKTAFVLAAPVIAAATAIYSSFDAFKPKE